MFSALLTATLGVLAALAVGRYIGLDASDVLRALLASNIAGFLAVLGVVNLQYVSLIKRFLMRGISGTWVFFLATYCVLTWALGPAGWGLAEYAPLSVPLVMSCGFSIVVFGPLQDAAVRRRQQKTRSRGP